MNLLNRAAVRRFALDYARRNRTHPFSRVSEDFMEQVEAALRASIQARIDRHPSKGKTLLS